MPERKRERRWRERQVFLGLAVLLLAPQAGAQNGLADSYNPKSPVAVYNAAWAIDPSVKDGFNAKLTEFSRVLTFGDYDVIQFVDILLQNLLGASRMEASGRVLGIENCEIDDLDTTPCMTMLTNAEHPACDTVDVPPAKAGCSLIDGCTLIICEDNIASINDLRRLPQIIGHEFGHTLGLSHSDATSSTSDGCEGELMCVAALGRAKSEFPTSGDALGLRTAYSSNTLPEERKMFFDRDTGSLNSPTWTQTILGVYAKYPPRIACAKSSNPTNKCVLAVASASLDRLIRLDGPSSETWTLQSVVQSFPGVSDMPPDVAINPLGTVAYMIRTAANRSTSVSRVPLNGDPVTTISLPGIKPVLPPRITWSDGQLQVVVLNEQPIDPLDPSQGFLVPLWTFRNVNASATTVSTLLFEPVAGGANLTSNFYMSDHRVISDFDFDCTEPGSGKGAEETCTIVAQVYRTDIDYELSALHSFRFRVATDLLYPFAAHLKAIDLDWDMADNYAARGVPGVVLTDSHLLVSHGRRTWNGTDTKNYRIQKFLGTSVGGTLVDHKAASLDAESCLATTNTHGDMMPGATTHGGTSIGFCESCYTGAVESVSWGRRVDNNDFCH